MPNILFNVGTQSQYDMLMSPRSENSLYFCTDSQRLYKGDILIGTGATVTETAAGLLSAADYVKLKKLMGFDIVTDLQAVSTQNLNTSLPTVGAVLNAISEISGGGEFVPIATTEVAGKVKASEEIEVAEDGTMSIGKVDHSKVVGLSEVYASHKYEIINGLFTDTLVNYTEDEIRICFAENSPFTLQQVGENGNSNSYYVGLKIYCPFEEATGFKEDLAEIISDNTMYDFNGDFSGIDKYGRKYSIVWLPVASYDGSTWTYFGNKSTAEKLIGWDHTIEWYSGETRIGIDHIRINLTNEACHNSDPYYLSKFITEEKLEDSVSEVVDDAIANSKIFSWNEIK